HAARAFDRARGVELGGARGQRSAAPFRLVEQACARQELTARVSQFAVAPSAPRARGVLRSREGSSAVKSGWGGRRGQAAVGRDTRDGISRDLALRVYTTRLIGRDPKLVLHGGGNTSVKTTLADLLGEEVAVLCVKGSGSDMAVIEPAGLPAVRLDRLRKLRARAALTDEEL